MSWSVIYFILYLFDLLIVNGIKISFFSQSPKRCPVFTISGLWSIETRFLIPIFLPTDRQIATSYSFLARVHDSYFIPNENDVSFDLTQFVANSNNVALRKNFPIDSRFGRFAFLEPRTSFDLVIKSPPNTNNENLFDYAELYIQLDDDLFARWEGSGGKGEGFSITNKGFLITYANHGLKINILG